MKYLINRSLIGIEKRGFNFLFENYEEILKNNEGINNATDSIKKPVVICDISENVKPIGYVFSHSTKETEYYQPIYQFELKNGGGLILENDEYQLIKDEIELHSIDKPSDDTIIGIINLIFKKMC